MGYNIPQVKARLLFRRKYVYADGAIVEMKAWSVPRSPSKPEGYKYSLVYIDAGGERLLGYDNAEGKGHHRHEAGVESQVVFHSLSGLLERFLEEVEGIRGPQP